MLIELLKPCNNPAAQGVRGAVLEVPDALAQQLFALDVARPHGVPPPLVVHDEPDLNVQETLAADVGDDADLAADEAAEAAEAEE